MPTIPTFIGAPIFGAAPVVFAYPNAARLQIETYPGVNGLSVKNLGSSGGMAFATGVLVADTLVDLSAIKQTWINLVANAVAGPLYDTAGTTWALAICRNFRPTEEIKMALPGSVSQTYQAEFLIIS